jgi:hypothetical protein
MMQVDAAGLATANQKLSEDAAGNKASYDKLQVGQMIC